MSSPQDYRLPSDLSTQWPRDVKPNEAQAALIKNLREQNAIPELTNILRDAFARTGWTDRVRAVALELIRDGGFTTFPALLDEVKRRAAIPPDAPYSTSATNGTTNGTNAAAGAAPTSAPGSSQNAIALSKEWTGGEGGLPDIRLPHAPLHEGAKYIRSKIPDVTGLIEDDDQEKKD